MPKRSFGFSIVELLIAVTIISVITASGAVLYKGATDNSKDQYRLRDLNTIKQALELYRHDQRSYPKELSELSTYLSPIPTDPQASAGKQYAYAASPSTCTAARRDCKAYVVCAKKQGDKSYDLPSGCSSVACQGTTGDCDMGVASDEPFLIVPTPTPVPAPFPSSGLAAYWKMDEAMDPLGAPTVVDYAGGDDNGISAASGITTGKIGNGRSFNGVNSRINVGNTPGVNQLSSMTIAAWINPDNADSTNRGIVIKWGEGTRQYYLFRDAGNRISIWLSPNGLTDNLAIRQSSSTIPANTWTHIVITYVPASSLNIYVNGELNNGTLTGVIPYSLCNCNAPMMLGPYPDQTWKGMMDEVGIWNRALSLPEIQALYNGGIGKQP